MGGGIFDWAEVDDELGDEDWWAELGRQVNPFSIFHTCGDNLNRQLNNLPRRCWVQMRERHHRFASKDATGNSTSSKAHAKESGSTTGPSRHSPPKPRWQGIFPEPNETWSVEFCQSPNQGTTSQSLSEAMQGRSKKVDSHGKEVAGVQQVRIPAAIRGQPAAILVGRSLVLGGLEEHMAIKKGWQFRQVWHNCRIVSHSLQN
jgi:hypothetical protein